ncbi:hypothetical protein BKA70DRAFT_1556786 [Coprinopsis sp. MPI-PUGE-AT-0042]|nr:hypothetical protein BKA70DRAFT_1556786 [Coprinopsis sp. MPI-PUGE-AT-0042]
MYYPKCQPLLTPFTFLQAGAMDAQHKQGLDLGPISRVKVFEAKRDWELLSNQSRDIQVEFARLFLPANSLSLPTGTISRRSEQTLSPARAEEKRTARAGCLAPSKVFL